MDLGGPRPVSIDSALAELTFLPDRTPHTAAAASERSFRRLSPYRDGGIFVGYWAGNSEWERHTSGDEIVFVVEGRTTVFFLTDDGERPAELRPGALVIVPQGTWHRFETPDGVKLLSVTPEPTDHRHDRPDRR